MQTSNADAVAPSAARWSPQVTLAVVAVFATVWAVALARWFVADAVVPWDSKNHFYPMLRFLADGLQQGELPLWNPFHFSGFPTAADPQSLLFTPTLLVLGLFDPDPSLRTFDVAVYAHLLAGGLALIALFRVRGWHPLGALLAALVFAFGGAAAGRLQHTGMIVSYAFLPIALVFLELALARRSHLAAAAFALAAALMAAGRDQVAFLSCLVLIAYAVDRLFAAESPWRFIMSRAGVLATAAVLGAILLLTPTLLTLQLLATSNRPAIEFEEAARGSLHWANLAGLFAPDVFGSYSAPHGYWGPNWGTTEGANVGDPSMSHIYLGLVPAVLVFLVGFVTRVMWAREVRFFSILLVIAVIYALGDSTPIFEALYNWVPGVSLYRRPADATFVLTACAAVVGGYVLHRIVIGTVARPKWPHVAAGVVVTLALAAGAVWFASRSGQAAASALSLAIGLAAAAAIALIIVKTPRRYVTPIAAAAVAITAADLVWRNAAAPFNAEPRAAYAVLEKATGTDERALTLLAREIARRQSAGQRPRVEIVGKSGPWLNAAMVHGVEDTVNYNPLRLAAYQAGVGPGENAGDYGLRHFPPAFRSYHSLLARLLGIEYLVFDRPIESLPEHMPRPRAELVLSGDRLFVYRLPNAHPRTYFATRTREIDSDLALEGEVPDFDPTFEALLDEATPTDAAISGTRDGAMQARVTITRYTANTVEIDVEAPTAGVVVLHDIFYPGWVVEVNGERRDLLRANLLFRGVEVTAGRHKIVFTFRPFALDNLIAAAQSLVAGSESETEAEAAPQAPQTPAARPAPVPPGDSVPVTLSRR